MIEIHQSDKVTVHLLFFSFYIEFWFLFVCFTCQHWRALIRPVSGMCVSLGSCLALVQSPCFCQTDQIHWVESWFKGCGDKCKDRTRNWKHFHHMSLHHHLPSAGPWHFHISDPRAFLLMKHTLSVCPPIGRGELQRSEVARAQRQRGARDRASGFTFHLPLSRFVYRTLSFAFLPLMKGRRVKTQEI